MVGEILTGAIYLRDDAFISAETYCLERLLETFVLTLFPLARAFVVPIWNTTRCIDEFVFTYELAACTIRA